MARQEATNIFSDGLMSDLHPINTPKSVLTDCLNGTYITYNGNEFILQNDMGNYKLKNCRLPVNFIPVGVKSYADILYIVSYNPITKEVEIGSYPAPQSIFTTGDKPSKIADEDDLAPFQFSGEVIYQEIINNNKKPLFVFTETDEETFKLNPGDEFQFSGELTTPSFSYQHLNFYVMDEDNKIYDLDDSLLYREKAEGGFELVSQDMRKVFWETPGWLAAQYDLYVPDKFNLNIRSLNVPEFLIKDGTNTATLDDSLINWEPAANHFKVSFDLSSQTIITDEFFQAELEKHILSNVYEHLFVRYIVRISDNQQGIYGTLKGIIGNDKDYTTFQDYTEDGSNYLYVDIPCIKYNYQDDILTAFTNVSVIWDFANPTDGQGEIDLTDYKGVIELTAYPILKQNEQNEQILKFTQFASTQRHQLNNLKNTNNIQIANSIYKWSIDDDSLTVSFNIDGPFVNALNFEGDYAVTKLSYDQDYNTFSVGNIVEENWQDISNLSVYGQNTINYENPSIKEDGLYAFSVRLKQNEQQIALQHFFLIPSEIFNRYFGTYDHYSALSFEQWVGKYIESIQLSGLDLGTFKLKFEQTINVKYSWNNTAEKPKDVPFETSWENSITNLLTDKYKSYYENDTWVASSSTVPENKLTLYFEFTLDPTLNNTVNFTLENPLLTGNLWNPVIEIKAELKQDYNPPVINLTQILPQKLDEDEDPTVSIELLTENSSNAIRIKDEPVSYQSKTITSPYYNVYDECKNMDENNGHWLVLKVGNGNKQRNVQCWYTYQDSPETELLKTSATATDRIKLGAGTISQGYNDKFGSYPCIPVSFQAQSYSGDVIVRMVNGDINDANSFSTTLVSDQRGSESKSQTYPTGVLMKSVDTQQGFIVPCYLQLTEWSEGQNPDITSWRRIKALLTHLARVVCYDYGSVQTGHFPKFSLNQDFVTQESITANQYNAIVKLNQLQYQITPNYAINWLEFEKVQFSNILYTNMMNPTKIVTEKTIPNISLNKQLTFTFELNETDYVDVVEAVGNIINKNKTNLSSVINNEETQEPYKYCEDGKDWPLVNDWPSLTHMQGLVWDKNWFNIFFNKRNSGAVWSEKNIQFTESTDRVLRVLTTKDQKNSAKIDMTYFVEKRIL